MVTKFKVELWLNGWDDADWHDDGKPTRFETSEEAQKEIDDVCHLMGYNPDDYRVVETE